MIVHFVKLSNCMVLHYMQQFEERCRNLCVSALLRILKCGCLPAGLAIDHYKHLRASYDAVSITFTKNLKLLFSIPLMYTSILGKQRAGWSTALLLILTKLTS